MHQCHKIIILILFLIYSLYYKKVKKSLIYIQGMLLVVKNFTFVFSLLMSSSLSFAAETSKLSLVESTFNEKYNSDVPVSGRILSGFMMDSVNKQSNMFLDIPNETVGIICLQVQSKDGSYFSSNEYQITDSTVNGAISPDYPTKYDEIIKTFDNNELAMLSFQGSCKQKKVNNLLIASRGADLLTTNVVFFINSGRSDVFLNLKDLNGKNNTIQCFRIKNGKRTAYDTECKVSLEEIKIAKGKVSILRRKSGRMFPSIKLNIRLQS